MLSSTSSCHSSSSSMTASTGESLNFFWLQLTHYTVAGSCRHNNVHALSSCHTFNVTAAGFLVLLSPSFMLWPSLTANLFVCCMLCWPAGTCTPRQPPPGPCTGSLPQQQRVLQRAAAAAQQQSSGRMQKRRSLGLMACPSSCAG
jgi:hypothetical protein